MDVQLAKQYEKRLRELFKEIEAESRAEKRKPTIERMQNITSPLYMVNSDAAQHIEEALQQLQYEDAAIVNAARATIQKHLAHLQQTIDEHPEPHFVLLGKERVFAKPVAGEELRSAVERGRLIHEKHAPYVHAFVLEPNVEDVLTSIDIQTLKPVLERLGFPNAEAILIFKTKAVPHVVHSLELIPSLQVAKLRAGIPVTVIKHRAL